MANFLSQRPILQSTIFYISFSLQPSYFKSRLSLIVRVNVVLTRTVVVDSD